MQVHYWNTDEKEEKKKTTTTQAIVKLFALHANAKNNFGTETIELIVEQVSTTATKEMANVEKLQTKISNLTAEYEKLKANYCAFAFIFSWSM